MILKAMEDVAALLLGFLKEIVLKVHVYENSMVLDGVGRVIRVLVVQLE